MSTPSQPLTATQPATVSDLQSSDASATHQVTDGSVQPVTPSKILMIAPTGGESALVPPDQVDSYLAKGAKVGVRMTAPDGKQKAIVPFDQQDQYQKQGATWDVHPDNDSAKNYLQAQATAKPLKDLSDHNRYMVSAMTGQGKDFSQDPTLSPEERQQAEAGRKAGTIQGGVDIAAGAVAGPIAGRAAEMLRPTMVAKTIGTGLIDAGGKEITRQVFEHGPSEMAQSLQKILPSKATVEQLEKIGRILYHVGAPTAAATYLFHELFGGK